MKLKLEQYAKNIELDEKSLSDLIMKNSEASRQAVERMSKQRPSSAEVRKQAKELRGENWMKGIQMTGKKPI